jgi:hypothetical protein
VIASSDVVSAPWLSRTLERPIASAVASRIGTVNGFAGVVLRLELFGSDGTTFSVIAKVGPDPSLDAEIRFYGRLAAALDAPAPDCLYAGAGPTGAPMLLLEDLSAARHGDALAGAPVADVAAVVESMVAFWRHRVDDPSLADLPQWGGEPDARQRRYAENWVAQRDALVDELPPDIWQTADRLVASLAQVAGRTSVAPRAERFTRICIWTTSCLPTAARSFSTGARSAWPRPWSTSSPLLVRRCRRRIKRATSPTSPTSPASTPPPQTTGGGASCVLWPASSDGETALQAGTRANTHSVLPPWATAG